jgi:hypothetical protein
MMANGTLRKFVLMLDAGWQITTGLGQKGYIEAMEQV